MLVAVYLIYVNMQPTIRLIFSAVGLALSVAVLAFLIIMEEPNIRVLIMLLALGMASQGMTLLDQVGEKQEKKDEQEN